MKQLSELFCLAQVRAFSITPRTLKRSVFSLDQSECFSQCLLFYLNRKFCHLQIDTQLLHKNLSCIHILYIWGKNHLEREQKPTRIKLFLPFIYLSQHVLSIFLCHWPCLSNLNITGKLPKILSIGHETSYENWSSSDDLSTKCWPFVDDKFFKGKNHIHHFNIYYYDILYTKKCCLKW